jgi:hypothetical protein
MLGLRSSLIIIMAGGGPPYLKGGSGAFCVHV